MKTPIFLAFILYLPIVSAAQASEFTDNEYGYTFQYPLGWKLDKPPERQPGDMGEVRVMLKVPGRGVVSVVVGNHGKTLSKAAFLANPNSEALIQQLIDFSIESIYKKTAKQMNASRISVLESRQMVTDSAVRFYISTLLFMPKNVLMAMIGTHIIPFEKPYAIVFLIVTAADKRLKEEQKMWDDVFNSFRLVDEKR